MGVSFHTKNLSLASKYWRSSSLYTSFIVIPLCGREGFWYRAKARHGKARSGSVRRGLVSPSRPLILACMPRRLERHQSQRSYARLER